MTSPHATVVKLGGSLLGDDARLGRVLDAVAACAAPGWVLVHGGGRTIDRFLARMDVPTRACDGLRVTDAATLEVVVAVLAGVVNTTLVAGLNARGVRAAGITGVDGDTLCARRRAPRAGVDLGYVAETPRVTTALLDGLRRDGFLPVVGSVARGPGQQVLNVNADAAAAALAVALRAERLVLLTDVDGVADARGERLTRLNLTRARALARSSVVAGGMKPKLESAMHALAAGVSEVCIASPTVDPERALRGKGGTRLVAA